MHVNDDNLNMMEKFVKICQQNNSANRFMNSPYLVQLFNANIDEFFLLRHFLSSEVEILVSMRLGQGDVCYAD